MSESRSGCRGCLVWFFALAALMLMVAGAAYYFGHQKLIEFRDHYTDTKPLALPVVSANPAELAAIHKRIDQFLDHARAGRTNLTLSLSARDLNALLAASAFSNRVYITLTNDAVIGRFSVPFEELGLRFLPGRYLNGSAHFTVGCPNGALSVTVKQITVNDSLLPEHYRRAFEGRNYAERFATNAVVRESLERVRKVVVQGEHLVFQAEPEGAAGAR
jgi:hypothetical protein